MSSFGAFINASPLGSFDAFPDVAVEVPFTAPADARALLTRIFEYRGMWCRSPQSYRMLGAHLRRFRSDVVVWSGACWTGREAYAAAFTCAEAGLRRWHVVGSDIDPESVRVARAGRYDAGEVIRDLPVDWCRRFFDFEADGTCRVAEHIRRHTSFLPKALGRDAAPACHAAIVSDMWGLLSDDEQAVLASQLDAALAPGGVLMLGTFDLLDNLESLDIEGLVTGRAAATAYYSPPRALRQRFRPIDGSAFQLLWCRK